MKKEAPRSVKGPPPSQRQAIKSGTVSEYIADDLNGIDAGNDNEHPHDEPDRFQNPILPCTMRSEGISTEEERKKLRSEERRVGKECVSTCRTGRTPNHSKKKTKK